MTAKRRLSDFDFSGSDAAVALVNKGQGGAANGYKTLITKATDVVVELSMAEFLTRFADMWSSDAQMVSTMLGFSDDISALWDGDELLTRVHPMKQSDPVVTDKLIDTVNVISKAMNITIKDIDSISKSNGVSPVSDNNQDGEIPMNETEVQALVAKALADKEADNQAAITKAVEQAKADAKADANAENEEIRKGLQEQLDKHEADKVAVEKANFVTIAKGYSALGVTDENAEAHAVALMKASSDESLKPLVEMLEKAQNVVKAAGEGVFTEQGHSVEDDAPKVSGVMKALQANKEA